MNVAVLKNPQRFGDSGGTAAQVGESVEMIACLYKFRLKKKVKMLK